MEAEIVRWGVIGCGDVAEKKGVPPLYRTQGSELVAVMRRNAKLAARFAEKHGAKRSYTDARDLVADPEINAVYVATPHDRHREHVTLAAEAGKMILCEKPMGASAADAQAIVDVCKANHVPLTVAYYRRFWYVTRAMQRLLREHAIGRPLQARVEISDYAGPKVASTWRNSRSQAGGGILADAGSHWIDLIRLFLGEITSVQADCVPLPQGDEVEGTLNAQLVTRDGVVISLILSRQSPTSINDFEILGTEGRLVASPFSEGRWLLDRPNKQPELVQFEHVGPAHTELIAELIPRLQQGESSPLPGEEAVANWRVMQAIYRACEQGRRVAME